MTRRIVLVIALCLPAWLGGCEVVPYQPQPASVPTPAPAPYPDAGYPNQPPPNYVYSDIRRCRGENQRAHADLLNDYERARSAGRISNSEARQFEAMEGRLRNLRGQLGRDGLTLQDCQIISNEIAGMRSEVNRMSRRNPALARCMADNRRAHAEVLGNYENARRSGRINPREAQRFNAIEGRLRNIHNDLARDGFSLQDCERMAGAIAYERDEVARMSRYVSPLTQCVADNRRAHDGVYVVYNGAQRAGRIGPREAQQFALIDRRLRAFQEAVKRDGMTLDECLRVGRAIAQERLAVERMAQQ